MTKKALTSKPNQRILKLSKPRILVEIDNGEESLTDYGVVKEALTAVSSQRTIKLSIPKIKIYEFAYEKPYISQQALEAQATTRIIELAKPKQLPIELKKKKIIKKRKCKVKKIATGNYLFSRINGTEYELSTESNGLETDFSSEHILQKIDLSPLKNNIKKDLTCDKDVLEKDLNCEKLLSEISSLLKILKNKKCHIKLSEL